MAGKKAKKNQQVYGTPLPLPFLRIQQEQQQQQQQQQQKKQPLSSASIQSKESNCHTRVSLWELWLTVLRLVKTFTVHSDSASLPLGLIEAEFHPVGESVWVKGHKDMAVLFQQGFFGKGTLSRSEATWKQRMSKGAGDISLEELTRQRRIERNKLKEAKAQQQLQQSSTLSLDSSATSTPISQSQAPSNATTPIPTTQSPDPNTPTPVLSPTTGSTGITTNHSKSSASGRPHEDEDYEHLQLSLEEAFFLVFAIDVLAIQDIEAALEDSTRKKKKSRHMSIQDCWVRFAESAVFKEQQKALFSHQPSSSIRSIQRLPIEIRPNNPFVVRYIAYHYFRSQGWVVKDGLKYGTDFMLYKKGMVFGHSRYSVRIIADSVHEQNRAPLVHPSAGYQGFLSPTPGLFATHGVLSWHWLLGLNRVIAQVQKTVILCHVIIPTTASSKDLSCPRSAIPLYSVAEVAIKRFLPERNRA